MTRYAIREPNKGAVIAYHVRHDEPDGSKRFTWELPDGTRASVAYAPPTFPCSAPPPPTVGHATRR